LKRIIDKNAEQLTGGFAQWRAQLVQNFAIFAAAVARPCRSGNPPLLQSRCYVSSNARATV